MDAKTPTLDSAYRACMRLAARHYENFSVASRLLPRDERRAFAAVYAFCRGVDDLGDELAGDRLAALNRWEAETRACFGGTPSLPSFVALQDVVQRHHLPIEPFLKLIEANRMDQRRSRYETHADVLRYCDHSANPVGHIVLGLYGCADEAREKLSDAICTALQLANFHQDVKSDYDKRGRIYLPLDDMRRFGVTEAHIAEGRADAAWRSLMAFEVGRAAALFDEGEPLLKQVPPRLRDEITLFLKGGRSVLDGLARVEYDAFRRRPAVPAWKKAVWIGELWIRRAFSFSANGEERGA